MNLFCFSLEGSMDSLYEPVPQHQEPKDTTAVDSRASTPVSVDVNCGPPDRSMSFEFPDIENRVIKKRKSIQKSMSENEAFDRKNVNGPLWQASTKPENDSYVRRHCQLEEDNIIGDGIHLLQGKKIEETTCQVINYEQWIPPQAHTPSTAGNSEMDTEPDDKAESMGTLKRLQKLVRTKKTSTQSLEDVKHVMLPLNTLEDAYLSEEDEEALTSCMKLTKTQEKKTWKDNMRRKGETETRADFISASLGHSYTSRLNNLGTISIHSETEFHLWSDWKPFPDNQLYPCDFLISKIEEWENCTCSSHQPHLTYSLTDMDLQYSWILDKPVAVFYKTPTLLTLQKFLEDTDTILVLTLQGPSREKNDIAWVFQDGGVNSSPTKFTRKNSVDFTGIWISFKDQQGNGISYLQSCLTEN